MACSSVCQLCKKLVISEGITFTDDALIVNLPDGSYDAGSKYCIVLAQTIPSTATITAPVVFTIGSGTTQFPLTTKNCAQVTACGVRTRTKYSTVVVTSSAGASFRMLGNPCCSPSNNLTSIDATTGGTAS